MDNIILENMYFEHNISSLTDKYIIECYEESYMCESVLDSIKTFFSNLKQKIKDIFNKIISKITGKNKDTNNKLNEIEDKIKDNPKLGLVKVQIADPNKVENEIDKQKKEYLNNKNKEKGKFKVDKKKVATAATVTVTLGAAVVLLKKGIIKLPSKVEKSKKEVSNTVDKCEQNATKTVENNSDNKEEVKEQQQEAAEVTQANEEAAAAEYESILNTIAELEQIRYDHHFETMMAQTGNKKEDEDLMEKDREFADKIEGKQLDLKMIASYHGPKRKELRKKHNERMKNIHDDYSKKTIDTFFTPPSEPRKVISKEEADEIRSEKQRDDQEKREKARLRDEENAVTDRVLKRYEGITSKKLFNTFKGYAKKEIQINQECLANIRRDVEKFYKKYGHISKDRCDKIEKQYMSIRLDKLRVLYKDYPPFKDIFKERGDDEYLELYDGLKDKVATSWTDSSVPLHRFMDDIVKNSEK
jgi:hypothetical protein